MVPGKHVVLEHEYRPLPPYDIETHLRMFTLPRRPVPYVYREDERLCTRLLVSETHGVKVAVQTRFHGTPWNPIVRSKMIVIEGKPEMAVKAVGESLRVDLDYTSFLEKIRQAGLEGILTITNRYPGLRPGRSLSLYEALIDTILKQRINLRLALRAQASLIERYGRRFSVGGTYFYGYPSPDVLARLSIDEIRAIGTTRMKARALRELARAYIEGRMPSTREAIKKPFDTIDALTELYGVGEWTAELAVALVSPMFPVGPKGDLAVRRGLEKLFGGQVEWPLEGLEEYSGLIMYLAALYYEESLKNRRKPGTRE